jgi:hypothetical protein
LKTSFRYFLLVSITCFVIASTYGQYYIGVKGGICVPDLRAGSDNPLSNGYETSLGADFGVMAELPINKWLSLQAEIEYSQEGGKRDGLQPFFNPYTNISPQTFLYANYNSGVRLNYLMLPVMAKFNLKLARKLKLYINAGGFCGLLLGGKTLVSGNSLVYLDPAGTQPQQVYPGIIFPFNEDENIKDSLKSFNAGVIAFIGFSYRVGRGKVFIEAGGNYGLIAVQKNPTNGTNYSGAVTAHVGYEYLLWRKRND